MKDATFTKGPWRVQPRIVNGVHLDEFYVVGPEHELTPEENEDHSKIGCEFIALAYGGLCNESPANARLLAASPELREACEAVESICDQLPNVLYDVLPLVRRALAKARGETYSIVGGSPSRADAADTLAATPCAGGG